jgi:predicted O-methyltransferase YrrM
VVNPVLRRLYEAGTVTHRDGRTRPLCPPGMTPERGQYLFDLVRAVEPAHTLEIGCAYGISTLFITEALRRNGRGEHRAIDPLEHARFDGLGLRHLEEAGLRGRVELVEEPAELHLPQLVREGRTFDLALNDSGHLLDHVMAEFLFLAMLVRRGGLLVFDDAGLPGVDFTCRFVATNRPDFEEVTAGVAGRSLARPFGRPLPAAPTNPRGGPLMRAFRKIADRDERDWSAFRPFV